LRGEAHPNAVLSEKDVLEIRASKIPAKVLAAKFRIHPKTIGRIRNHYIWKHLPRQKMKAAVQAAPEDDSDDVPF
jgi:hypothetical protein